MPKVEVDINSSRIHGRFTDDGLGQFLANEAAKGMSPYVPFREGYLDASAIPTPFLVTYDKKYARRLFEGEGMRISKERHPNATAHWNKAYASAHGQELARAAQDYLKR